MRYSAAAIVMVVSLAQAPVFAEEPRPSLQAAALREAVRQAPSRELARARQGSGQGPTWRSRHPVLFGTVIGASVGAVTGCAVGSSLERSDSAAACGFVAGPVGLLGAGVGALVGVVTR